MARRILNHNFDLTMENPVSPPEVFSLEGIDELTIESSSALGVAWVASTITFEVCNDYSRGNWKAPPSGAVTITSATITDPPLNVSAYGWGRLRPSAAAASAFRVNFSVHGEGAN